MKGHPAAVLNPWLAKPDAYSAKDMPAVLRVPAGLTRVLGTKGLAAS